MTDKHYHIDVTPEEDMLFREKVNDTKKTARINFTKTFWLVFGVHAFLISCVVTTGFAFDQKQSKNINFTEPVDEMQAVSFPEPSNERPTEQKKTKKYTEVYVIKSGDTIYSIANKYKLNIEKLLKINGIKDANKIYVGQKLKFIE